jgi:hypothetical protein
MGHAGSERVPDASLWQHLASAMRFACKNALLCSEDLERRLRATDSEPTASHSEGWTTNDERFAGAEMEANSRFMTGIIWGGVGQIRSNPSDKMEIL